jgi:hypothetical protein
MTDETAKIIDDLLARWHRWCDRPPIEGGYPTECPSCRGYRTSKQYDDTNGALDTDIEGRMMIGLDALIHSTLEGVYLTAIQCNARNLAIGAAVFRTPRISAEDMQARIGEARSMLAKALGQSGII